MNENSQHADLARAQAGDDAAFARLVTPLRQELHTHCYRMLGSVHDADDAVQDALLRAWRGLAGYRAQGTLRSWLYTVATRTCLDLAAARARRAMPVDLGPASDHVVLDSAPAGDVAWLEPCPTAADDPGSRYERREAIELAFVAALQYLPGNQRAALLLFDVLGFSAAEIAAMMATSTTSVNSALARARKVIASRVPQAAAAREAATHSVTSADRTTPDGTTPAGASPDRTTPAGASAHRAPAHRASAHRASADGVTRHAMAAGTHLPPGADDARLRRLASAFASAFVRGDAEALIALLTEDVTWAMPPLPHWYAGRDAVLAFAVAVPFTRCPSFRFRLTEANRQPAVAFYLGAAPDAPHEAWSITVLTTRGDRVEAITSFLDPALFPAFALPATLPA